MDKLDKLLVGQHYIHEVCKDMGSPPIHFLPHVCQIRDHHRNEPHMQQHKDKLIKNKHVKTIYNLTIKA